MSDRRFRPLTRAGDNSQRFLYKVDWHCRDVASVCCESTLSAAPQCTPPSQTGDAANAETIDSHVDGRGRLAQPTTVDATGSESCSFQSDSTMASTDIYSTDELKLKLEQLPRFPLAHLPTPLEFLPRFSQALGGPRIWMKRDDCTGLAFGGNKTRHAELLIADALSREADTIVWGAGIQSNNCRQTAAACAKAGLDCHLVLGRGAPATGADPLQGNLLLDHLVGASIEIVEEAEGPELDKRDRTSRDTTARGGAIRL